MSYNIIDVLSDIVTGELKFAPCKVSKERYTECKNCEVRNKQLNICTICGCVIPLKVILEKSSCPMGKW